MIISECFWRYGVGLFLLAYSSVCFGTSIKAVDGRSSFDKPPIRLGGGYNSVAQKFTDGYCIISNQTTKAAAPIGVIDFSSKFDSSETAKNLGIGVSGRARFGVASGSFSATYLKLTESDTKSVSANWISFHNVFFQTLKDDPKGYTSVGASVKGNTRVWNNTCGDEYVSAILKGGRIYVGLNINFKSEKQKESFESKFTISGPIGSLSGTLAQASQEFSKDVQVKLSFMQIGGNTSQIGKVVGSTDGKIAIVSCTFGDFEACNIALNSAIKYATTDFRIQLEDESKLADLEYITSTYSSKGLYSSSLENFDVVNRLALDNLFKTFERNYRDYITAERLLDIKGSSTSALKKPVTKIKDITNSNMITLQAAADRCYELPTQCSKIRNTVITEEYDQAILALPPLPTAQFRLMNEQRGILSRNESLEALQSVICSTNGSGSPPLSQAEKDRCRLGYQSEAGLSQLEIEVSSITVNRYHLYGWTGLPGNSSIAIYVSGKALKSAQLCFENKCDLEFDLTTANGFPDKLGEGWRALVVESSKQFPGWRDIDMDAFRSKLIGGGIKSADGRFYLRIYDIFDRFVDMDIEFQSWSWTEGATGSRYKYGVTLQRRNKWWEKDSSLQSIFPFSTNTTVSYSILNAQ